MSGSNTPNSTQTTTSGDTNVGISNTLPPNAGPKQYDQWIRKSSLIVATDGTQGIDLSQLRFRFNIVTNDQTTFNDARIRVYNLAAATVKKIIGSTPEFTRVRVEAGYVNGSYGVIFNGTIKQIAIGKESNVDSYLDIFAADGDFVRYALINSVLTGAVTQQNQVDQINKQLAPTGVTVGPLPQGQVGGILPRGKVLFGLAMDQLRNLGKDRLSTWSIQQGVVTEIPLNGYLPAEVVVLNSETGLIGQPEATQNGIIITCLLNPKIGIGNRVQINNGLINQTIVKNRAVEPGQDSIAQYALVAPGDGIYRVVCHEFEGDTRGNPWYSKIVGLLIDPTAPPATSVQTYG